MADIAFTLLEVAVKNLYTVYKHHKDLKTEVQEVGNFLVDLRASSPILNATSSSGSKLNRLKKTLQGKLESARKQVEEWSSKNSDFFSMLHSGERLLKVQGVRQKVNDAMKEADTQLAVYNFVNGEDGIKLLVDNNKLLYDIFIKLNIPPQDNKRPAVPHKPSPPDKPSPPAKPIRVQHPKPNGPSKPEASIAQGSTKRTPPRSKSTGRAGRSSKAPSDPKPRSTSASRPRRDKMVELFVPMDSEKQARDVVGKLEALPGVKSAFPDQTSKKVSVRPHKGVTLNTDQLLQHAKLENKFVAPTLWSQRPR